MADVNIDTSSQAYIQRKDAYDQIRTWVAPHFQLMRQMTREQQKALLADLDLHRRIIKDAQKLSDWVDQELDEELAP